MIVQPCYPDIEREKKAFSIKNSNYGMDSTFDINSFIEHQSDVTETDM